MTVDAREARSLLLGPPSYEEGETIEPFEIEDPMENAPGNSNWLSKMSDFGSNRIYRPVMQVIDPISNFWRMCCNWVEMKMSKYVNVLIFKRVFFLAFLMSIVGSIYYFHSDSLLGATFSHINHKRLIPQLRNSISMDSIKAHTEYFNSMPHYAGSSGDKYTRDYVYDYFMSLGLQTKFDQHDIFISHGKQDSNLLELKSDDGSVLWQSKLTEPQFDLAPSTQMSLVLPGECEGELVYANYGFDSDLDKLGVDIANKLVLVKFSGEDPGSVALRLEQRNACGVLFFSDNKHNKDEQSFPNGANFPDDAIEQRQMGFSQLYPGDILSPGWPSSMNLQVPIQTAHIAHIPAAAMSWNDAKVLLEALKGSGSKQDNWDNNGKPEGITEFWTGPIAGKKVHLKTDPSTENRHQISNVIGSMKGREEASQIIVIGTRLDTACFGGSGTAGLTVMLEVARAFANLRFNNKWQPLRTILFAVWDGTTQNYAGSTEWVESVAENLYSNGIAYIDLDAGISGPDFVLQTNPMLSPDEIMKNTKLNDSFSLWDAVDFDKSFFPIQGSGNHLAFDPHTGVPSIKVGFEGRAQPRDSCYDNLDFMLKVGDPDYSRHRALADFVLNLALDLADEALIPYDFDHLAAEIHRYTDDIANEIKATTNEPVPELDEAINQIHTSADKLKQGASIYQSLKSDWENYSKTIEDKDTGYISEGGPISAMRRYWNDNVEHISKIFLDRNGIPRRNWYKNHLFGPSYDYVDGEKLSGTMPAVRDSLRTGDLKSIRDNLLDVASHIEHAAARLLSVVM